MTTAAFTIARNEPFFLPLWLTYYGHQVGTENLFVLDHESDDGSTEGLACNVVPVSTGGICYNHEWLAATVADFQAKLLADYDTVVFADADEFLCYPGGLARLLQDVPEKPCRATGYHLLHTPGEAPYDATLPVLAQRGQWAHEQAYDKTLISREPLIWNIGFHALQYGAHGAYVEGLTLVHLHQFDRGVAHARHNARKNWQWHPGEQEQGRSKQWTLANTELDFWMDEALAGAEPVAEWLREEVPF